MEAPLLHPKRSIRRAFEIASPTLERLVDRASSLLQGMAETTTQKSIDLFWDDVVSALEAKAGELPGLLEDDEVRHAIGDFRQRRLEEMRKHLVHDDPDRAERVDTHTSP